YNIVPSVLLNLILAAILLSVCADMKKLQAAARAIADGDLDYRVDTSRMRLDFKACGEDLNRIGDGLTVAVEDRLKSERMKTELITNVSHDLKTPLTSIVSYVDLLKKEELPEKAAEYVEVLDRQSARLKKLTEDLVEASKASTGNLHVALESVDLGEFLEQAQAEYAARILSAELEVVAQPPAGPLLARSDGRYLWRIMDNLLGNACKYAMSGTRVYLAAERREDRAVLSVKNISRERLNISADELMERFVRGDSSRNTEGSGLGLSIAQSLAALMGGKLELTVDGDLFKAEVFLPLAEAAEN
ncbi:MAG: histidine kinase dimerization/phospho-acceptor domain-containing protein, partial [Oscillospiraceae bacterium]|nr:histidine kinase dimerization/phospho-acceptor domain-containing protein [Oscillospiraceae bacterium]